MSLFRGLLFLLSLFLRLVFLVYVFLCRLDVDTINGRVDGWLKLRFLLVALLRH